MNGFLICFFVVVFVIAVSHVFWIVVWMVYATIVREQCFADAHSEKVEINAKMVSIENHVFVVIIVVIVAKKKKNKTTNSFAFVI